MVKTITFLASLASIFILIFEYLFMEVNNLIIGLQVLGLVTFITIYLVCRSEKSLKVGGPLSIFGIWIIIAAIAYLSPHGDMANAYHYFPLLVIAAEFLVNRTLCIVLYLLTVSFLLFQMVNTSPILSPTYPMNFLEGISRCTMALGIGIIFNRLKVSQQSNISKRDNQLKEKERLLAIQRMAGNIAHELNNPLAIIEFGTTLIQKKQGDAPEKIYNSIESAVARISHISNQFRKALEIDRIAIEVGDTQELVEAIVKQHPDQGLVQVKIPENLQWKVDPSLMKYTLVELITNAAAAGASQIELRARITSSFWELDIIDNGHGFDNDSKHDIKEPFQGQKTDAKGKGSGLFMCKVFLVMMEIKLNIESEAGNTKISLRGPKVG